MRRAPGQINPSLRPFPSPLGQAPIGLSLMGFTPIRMGLPPISMRLVPNLPSTSMVIPFNPPTLGLPVPNSLPSIVPPMPGFLFPPSLAGPFLASRRSKPLRQAKRRTNVFKVKSPEQIILKSARTACKEEV